jgi:hypothetical protein
MSSLRASAVTINTGKCLSDSSFLMAASRSKPFMLGMLMSLTTKSNFELFSMFRATAPSSASSALLQPISLSRPRTMRRMVEKSSTIRNFSSVGVLMSVLVGARFVCLSGGRHES